MKKTLPLALLIFLIFIILPAETEAQCAMCKASAESAQKNSGNIANGLNNGILFLMGIPYILLFLFFRKRISGLFKSIIALYRNPQKV